MKRGLIVALSCLGLSTAVVFQEARASVVGPDPGFTDLRIGGCFDAWLDHWWDVFGKLVDEESSFLLYSSWADGQNDTNHDDMLLFYPGGTGLRTLTWTVPDDSALVEVEVLWYSAWEKVDTATYEMAFTCESATRYIDGEVETTGCADVETLLDEALSFSADCVSAAAGSALVCDERGGQFIYYRADAD